MQKRDAVHIVFASERVKADSLASAPDVTESEVTEIFRLVNLGAQVRMKLTVFRDKDRPARLDRGRACGCQLGRAFAIGIGGQAASFAGPAGRLMTRMHWKPRSQILAVHDGKFAGKHGHGNFLQRKPSRFDPSLLFP